MTRQEVASKATELIVRKQRGGDCSEDESVWIKGYFDAFPPETTPQGTAMANVYPCEHSEWGEELERGDRPNDTGKALIALFHSTGETLMQHGTLVTPPGDTTGDELIIGLVVGEPDNGHLHVCWFSNQRGVFWCLEAPGDLEAAPCAQRMLWMTDPTISHAHVATLLAPLMKPRPPFVVQEGGREGLNDLLMAIVDQEFLYLDEPDGSMAAFILGADKGQQLTNILNRGLTQEQLEGDGFDWRLHNLDDWPWDKHPGGALGTASHYGALLAAAANNELLTLLDRDGHTIGYVYRRSADKLIGNLI